MLRAQDRKVRGAGHRGPAFHPLSPAKRCGLPSQPSMKHKPPTPQSTGIATGCAGSGENGQSSETATHRVTPSESLAIRRLNRLSMSMGFRLLPPSTLNYFTQVSHSLLAERDLENGGKVCGFPDLCAELACADSGEFCQDTGDCCPDNTCTEFSDTHVVCAYNCTYNSQCVSSCCVPLEGAGNVCAPSEYCGLCVPSGGECSPGDCCSGSTCVWIDYVGAICQEQGACPSGCEGNAGICCRPPFCAGNCVGSPCCS